MKIEQTPSFKRDYKKLKKKHYDMNELKKAVETLVVQDSQRLMTKYKDHALKGQWKGYRELHIEGNWLLIYKINNEAIILTLVRTGSHDELL